MQNYPSISLTTETQKDSMQSNQNQSTLEEGISDSYQKSEERQSLKGKSSLFEQLIHQLFMDQETRVLMQDSKFLSLEKVPSILDNSQSIVQQDSFFEEILNFQKGHGQMVLSQQQFGKEKKLHLKKQLLDVNTSDGQSNTNDVQMPIDKIMSEVSDLKNEKQMDESCQNSSNNSSKIFQESTNKSYYEDLQTYQSKLENKQTENCIGKFQTNQDLDLDEQRCEAELQFRREQLLKSLEQIDDDVQLVVKSKQKSLYLQTRSQRGSKFRGVSKNGKKWQVMIVKGIAKKYLGAISSEQRAARLYDKYAMIIQGLQAKTNFSYTKRQIVLLLDEDDDIQNEQVMNIDKQSASTRQQQVYPNQNFEIQLTHHTNQPSQQMILRPTPTFVQSQPTQFLFPQLVTTLSHRIAAQTEQNYGGYLVQPQRVPIFQPQIASLRALQPQIITSSTGQQFLRPNIFTPTYCFQNQMNNNFQV
ncbi:ap2-like ethylene-responsive transcription factor [Stylonychia lemnae]|uniref:Ap2-like ethylene-responsive transcription factor n=1 Tax=Stylonychia lemnae TaxID=5949 RepID=A0A078A6R9_STYLE|nr:ap2-like ethylene-responsive transcription factor [Stylonychia lemnae]|eukprot:CDW77894.1 ap2-like ethylene-responsive transcription factor [Stylonychia lemnae]